MTCEILIGDFIIVYYKADQAVKNDSSICTWCDWNGDHPLTHLEDQNPSHSKLMIKQIIGVLLLFDKA